MAKMISALAVVLLLPAASFSQERCAAGNSTTAAPSHEGIKASASVPETEFNTSPKPEKPDKEPLPPRKTKKIKDLPDENGTVSEDLEGFETRHPLNATHETWKEMRESQKDE